MAGFIFESNLKHQQAAVDGVMEMLDDISVSESQNNFQNPLINAEREAGTIFSNLKKLQKNSNFQQDYEIVKDEKILDISMETGTGKTYVYTKTMFELNKESGVAKFIVAVPRIAIKAGTVNFLKSDSARQHFRKIYDKDIKVYEVRSKNKTKGKKEKFPQAISDFCRADLALSKNSIHVLVINSGMITSKTMRQKFDVQLWDKFNQPVEALAHTRPVLIVDEPHMFKRGNKAYKAMMEFNPQFVLRYGATFDGDLINLAYELTAVDAFNDDLVKGIVAHVEKFDEGKNISLRLTNLKKDTEATFELNINGKKTKYSLAKKESFETIHNEMKNLQIEQINTHRLVLSNGLELAKNDVINPYSYSQSLQDKMIASAIKVHFEKERKLFLANPKIKPLTLFFIDNINSYRDEEGQMRQQFELLVKSHVKSLIKKESDKQYKKHLENALKDISALHGGYFSKDNSEKDESIEKETMEILYEKERLLSLDNPRRFIFSKWTLREGWDNPNVFTICKLRSSGSETSKLQEVGRGLRLPVNEFMARDKGRDHFLDYFVDFTEDDFASKLVNEINEKSNAVVNEEKFDQSSIDRLLHAYDEFQDDAEKLLEALDKQGIISRSNAYRPGGYEKLRKKYPRAFIVGIKDGKVKKKSKQKNKATIRAAQYDELKALWEKLNRKVVLEYNCTSEELVKFFKDYMLKHKGNFNQTGMHTALYTLKTDYGRAAMQGTVSKQEFTPIKTMGYQKFLKELCEKIALNMQSMHEVFCSLKKDMKIQNYMNHETIRTIHFGFNEYLMENVFNKFSISYKKTSNEVHPTKLTDEAGEALKQIDSSDIGIIPNPDTPPTQYLFNEIFYDSKLERENIQEDIEEVIVYTKIPKNSIRVPVIGGSSYSPDFAYVIKGKNGISQLNLIVETKDKTEGSLTKNEEAKIRHAKTYFGDKTNITFETQLQNKKMQEIIKEVINNP